MDTLGHVFFIGMLACCLVIVWQIFMIHRNQWVFRRRIDAIEDGTYEQLPSYDYMMRKWWIWDVKKFYPVLLACFLTSCGGANFATFHPDGTPKMLASMDGLLHDADATAREQNMSGPNGWSYTSRSVQQNPSGTKAVSKIIDGWATKGIATALSKSEVAKAEADRDVRLKETEMKPNPNDGIVETEGGVFTPENSFVEEPAAPPQ